MMKSRFVAVAALALGGWMTMTLGGASLVACGGTDVLQPDDSGLDGTVEGSGQGDGSGGDSAGNDATLDSNGSDGSGNDGALPDGALPDGALPDGALPDGALPDGALGDGAVLDGGSDGAVQCLQNGGACTKSTDCCTGACTNNVCNPLACISDNQPCNSNASCCGGSCVNNVCAVLNPTCRVLGNACTTSADCCSQLCQNNVCSASSFCGQNGDVCTSGAQCCGGACNIVSGTVGTCAPPPTGAANCTQVDGTVCGGVAYDGGTADAGYTLNDAGVPTCGGACCSRLCAPYGPTGVYVCQPASGCHVVGDLCRQDSDCCGSAGSAGSNPPTPVTCDITAPNTVGVCRNPMGCKPNGDVCKLATMSCSETCDCCAGNCETKDTCKTDNVGVPRCTNVNCVGAGQGCASSADCCNGLPCVPNPADGGTPHYICYTSACVPTGGNCTINADCCVGDTCIVNNGSSSGTCGIVTSDGGVITDAAALVDSSTVTDGGTVADGGTVTDATTTTDSATCAVYGQICTVNADCCNGIPCTSGRCVSP